MFNLNKNKIFLSLICGSLILLLLFLISWINKNYEEEKAGLQKEIHYVLSDIVSSIEDSLFQNVFLQNLTVRVDSMTHDTLVVANTRINLDTSNIFNYVIEKNGKKRKQEFIRRDSTFKVMIRSDNIHVDNVRKHDLLSFLISQESDTPSFAIRTEEHSPKAVELITKKFDHYIANSNIPKSYELVEIEDKIPQTGIISHVYFDPHDSKSYGARFSNYSIHLIKKIFPQILFCLFLFGAICASFLMIYSNWRKQQRLIEIKNDLISNVTHELKTPISTVGVALEALSSFDALEDPKKTEEYLSISKHELSRLNILVDKVLKMSIFEKGASKLDIADIDLKTLVEEILSSMKLHFEKLRANVKFTFTGNNFNLEGDRIHLTNVIYNLIDNALKYSPSQPDLKINLENHDKSVHLIVSDRGVGIPQKYIHKVFDRFFRVPTGDRHNVKGHGLGLSYVAQVIEKHHGLIDVISKAGEGTTFHISLPRTYDKG